MKSRPPDVMVWVACLVLALAGATGWFAHQEQQRSSRLMATLGEMRGLEERARTSLERLEAVSAVAHVQKPVAFDVLLRTYWEHPGIQAELGKEEPFAEGWVVRRATLRLSRVEPADVLVFVRTVGRQEPPWALSRVALNADEGQSLSGEMGFEMVLPESLDIDGGDEL